LYRGEWAEEAVETLRTWGSNITLDHVAEYLDHNRPDWQDPQVDQLTNDATMYSIGAKNQCARAPTITQVVEVFGIMQELGLINKGGPDFTNDGNVLSYFLLVSRYAFYMEFLTNGLGLANPLLTLDSNCLYGSVGSC
jgi:hypothetical protein